jgi:uncharacterized protein HemY
VNFYEDDKKILTMTMDDLVCAYNMETGKLLAIKRWDDPKLWYYRGMIFAQQGMWMEADDCFEKALECDGNFKDAMIQKAAISKRMNRTGAHN